MPTQTAPQGDLPAAVLRLPAHALVWYYRDHPMRILRSYSEYALAFRESFSILFLLKTLFSPWKSIKDSYSIKGLNMQAILEVLFLNITTRGIGAIIRLSAIITGLVIQIVLLVGFLLYLILWLLFPIAAALLPFYVLFAFFR